MRKAFTIIELIIAISLLLMVVTFLYSTLHKSQIYNKIFSSQIKKTYHKNIKLKTIYQDIFNASYVKIIKNSQNISTLILKTTNSLYNLSIVYVVYIIRHNHLYRIESIKPISLRHLKNKNYEDFGKIKIFRIFNSNKGYLIYLKNNTEDYFEVKKWTD